MPLSQSRRQFLQLSTALAVGAYGPLSFGDQSRLEGRSACAVGLLCSHEGAPALRQAVTDAGAHVACCGDELAMLQDAAINAVVIGRGLNAPEEAARFAIERRLHVFSLEPLGRSIGEVRELAELARRRQVVLRTGDLSSATDSILQIVSLIEAGELGGLREIVCWTSRCDQSSGSREFQVRGCNVLSVPFQALGSRQPVTIYGAGSPTGSEFPSAIAVRYEFPAQSSGVPLHVTWYDGEWAPPYESIDEYPLPLTGTLYLGDNGQLLDDPATGARVLFRNRATPESLPSLPAVAGSALQQWLHSCLNQLPTSPEFEPAERVNAAVLAGLASYRVRQSLEWDGSALCARHCPQADALCDLSGRT